MRMRCWLTSDLPVKVIVPLVSPLVAVVALYFVVKLETDEFHRALSTERESIMRSVVGISRYAERVLEDIYFTYVDAGSPRDEIPVRTTIIDEYKKAVVLLCKTVYSDHSINHIFYSQAEFAEEQGHMNSDSYGFLAENCVRSANLVPGTVGANEGGIGSG